VCEVNTYLKQHAGCQFLTDKNETPIGTYQSLLTFYGEDTVDMSIVDQWVRKLEDSGGNLDLSNQPWSRRPVTSTHDLNRQNVGQFFEEN
jgi:hypothetical protein